MSVLDGDRFAQLGKPPLLAAGDEDLTAGDAVEDKFLPTWVQLGEHIVEQEDGRKARQLAENVALGEFEGERRGAGLALRGKGAGGSAADGDLDIVLMRAGETKTRGKLGMVMVALVRHELLKDCLLRRHRVDNGADGPVRERRGGRSRHSPRGAYRSGRDNR